MAERNKTEMAQSAIRDMKSEEEEAAELAERLRTAIDHAGGISVVARNSAGRLSPRTLHRYLSGDTEPGISAIRLIAQLTKWSLDWLVSGDQAAERSGRIAPLAPLVPVMAAGTVDLPKMTFMASAGSGALVVEGTPDVIAFPALILEHVGIKPQNGALMEGSGESMTPTIQDGELLLMDTSLRELRDDKIYVFAVGEECYVKRLRRVGNRLIMRSDNPDFPDEPVPAGESFQVFGMVKWAGRSL